MPTTDAMFSRAPWRDLPPALVGRLRPRLAEINAELTASVRREVPAYRQPPDSAVGRDVELAGRRSLEQFAELVEDPDRPQEEYAAYFQRLGRIEYRNGRGADSLQAAYRAGARVAARWYTSVARSGGFPADVTFTLNDAVLVHISALSNDAVRGCAAAMGDSDSDVARARLVLAKRLLDPVPPAPGPAAEESLELLATRARWPWPRRVVCVVAPAAASLPDDLDEQTLSLWRGTTLCLVVPAPGGDGPGERLRRAVRAGTAAIGPAVAPEDAMVSLRCARLALRLLPGTPRGGPRGVIDAAEHLAAIHLLSGAPVGDLLAERALQALRHLTPGKAARLADTLDALLMSWRRTAPEVAETLRIHPQTARYRIRQLEEIFGPRLTDPQFRMEAMLALRTRALTGAGNPRA